MGRWVGDLVCKFLGILRGMVSSTKIFAVEVGGLSKILKKDIDGLLKSVKCIQDSIRPINNPEGRFWHLWLSSCTARVHPEHLVDQSPPAPPRTI